MIFYHADAQEKIKYTFKNSNLLRQCFTHSSYSNEHKGDKSNERLEFLGDSVLGLIITEYLYKNKREDEGGMTNDKQRIVSTKPLSDAIKNLGLEQYLLVSNGETRIITDKVCENLFEAIVGGIYLDGGYEEAKKFVLKNLIPAFENNNKNGVAGDYKTQLNEYVAKRKLTKVEYVTIEKKGSDHSPVFVMAVVSSEKELGRGEGKSKKAAEQAAAKVAMQNLKKTERKQKC